MPSYRQAAERNGAAIARIAVSYDLATTKAIKAIYYLMPVFAKGKAVHDDGNFGKALKAMKFTDK